MTILIILFKLFGTNTVQKRIYKEKIILEYQFYK